MGISSPFSDRAGSEMLLPSYTKEMRPKPLAKIRSVTVAFMPIKSAWLPLSFSEIRFKGRSTNRFTSQVASSPKKMPRAITSPRGMRPLRIMPVPPKMVRNINSSEGDRGRKLPGSRCRSPRSKSTSKSMPKSMMSKKAPSTALMTVTETPTQKQTSKTVVMLPHPPEPKAPVSCGAARSGSSDPSFSAQSARICLR